MILIGGYEPTLDDIEITTKTYHDALFELPPQIVLQCTMFMDGETWCILLGEDELTGIMGMGNTPDAALSSFILHYKGAVANAN